MSREMPVISFGRNVVEGGESTISDLARSYGVSLRTLRFYEDRGLLHPRRHGTMRYYGAADRVRLELILKGKRLGFTLSEIQDLISSRAKVRAPEASEVDSNDLTISLGREQIAAQIDHLERQRADIDGAIEELRRAYERMAERAG